MPGKLGQTVIPHAKIGDYLTVVRKDRDSENWYLGSITNEEARELNVKLGFLDKHATYTARVFADGGDADYKDNPYPVNIYETDVTANDSLELHLSRGGGATVIFEKNLLNSGPHTRSRARH